MLLVKIQPWLSLQITPIMHHGEISAIFHSFVTAIDLSSSGERERERAQINQEASS